MKPPIFSCVQYFSHRLLVSWIVLWLVAGSADARNETPQNELTSRGVTVKGALPGLVKTGLEFSAQPTPEEIFRAHLFEEPLAPIGGAPASQENTALAAALIGYSKRSGPDDFSSFTRFLEEYPHSSWRAALLTDLGLEYYNTAHYSDALRAWAEAWRLAKDSAADRPSRALADRAGGELAYMYARLGRMSELEVLLKSVEGRVFVGPATEKIAGAREGLWNMQHRPEISFRCGPLALLRIKKSIAPGEQGDMEIFNSASTQRGFSLQQVADLSKKIGLNYKMAFREKGGEFVVPAVVHWKVGHYAAMLRQEGARYLLEDPTFGNTTWATRQALDEETSGYFLVPPGPLRKRWRAVESGEGHTVWGKGVTASNDPRDNGCKDLRDSGGSSCDPDDCTGMAVPAVHLMLVNLNLRDQPAGYTPPVGPPVKFTVRYNHREAFQPASFNYANFGSKWSCDWISYITDTPSNNLADVNYYIRGGGTRTFTGFDTNTQTYGFQQLDQSQLKRTGVASYEMLRPDGSKFVFSQSDGSAGASRKIFLTQVLDPYGNAVTLSYDGNLRLTTITDAIGQVTALSYALAGDIFKVTKVTDPFGRFATFSYDTLGRLTNITDVIGLNSQFSYETTSDFINALTTPYGTTTFVRADSGNTRRLDTIYPDGSRDRVEYNQSTSVGIPASDPSSIVPQGMGTLFNSYLYARNTYYWSRNASATAYGDYTKAKIYHWLHQTDVTQTSGILESIKEPLERRVWYDYSGQVSGSLIVGDSNRPQHIGRVLDDGSTQLYTYFYNGFGNVTNSIDPLGRAFSYIYATNGIDLLEARMTRAGKNELLFRATYNSQHLPLTTTDAAGQTTSYTYNSRGQLLTRTNPKNETTTYTYDANGYLVTADGPLPGASDTTSATYDSVGRIRTKTDVSGYTLTFDYDALDRITRITHPDSTFEQISYNRLDASVVQDRAQRQTFLEYDSMRQLARRTDPLGRVNLFQWCSCGDIKSLTDPLGRTTTWHKDIQNRLTSKQYGDGSQVTYIYENATSRLRQMTDEKLQITEYSYNPDNSVRSIAYANTINPTPGVTFAYDANYLRPVSMTDGIGSTVHSYVPITSPAVLGAGQLARIDGPLQNETITYLYDELGRPISTAINGIATALMFDAAGRLTGETNALGSFSYSYDGSSDRMLSEVFPNGQTTSRSYGDNLHDLLLQQITYQVGATPISQFTYGRDIPAARITTWTQQIASSPADVYSFGYDAADQLLFGSVTNSGLFVNNFAYAYDAAGNRLVEQAPGVTNTASYNALNQISSCTCTAASSRTNEWDAADRLKAVTSGNQRTEFAYDGLNRLATIRLLTNGTQASLRAFVWCGDRICEEHDGSGAITKRFFPQGMKVETGANAGNYYYTRDHLGSVREVTDSSGTARARYAYDPYGRRTLLAGDVSTDFGFAGMFWSSESGLALTRFRSYDPELGRWLSRDPLLHAEMEEGQNLYTYVANNPVNSLDPLGLCCEDLKEAGSRFYQGKYQQCEKLYQEAREACAYAERENGPGMGWANGKLSGNPFAQGVCEDEMAQARKFCKEARDEVDQLYKQYLACLKKPCGPKCKPSGGLPRPKPRQTLLEAFRSADWK